MRRAAGLHISLVGAVLLAAGQLKAAEDLSKVPSVDMSTVLYDARPEYPFEARQKKLIGSGVVLLDVDPRTGRVTRARMAKSTGHRVLDDEATKAFSRWRFRQGVPARQKMPVTFTRTGLPPEFRR